MNVKATAFAQQGIDFVTLFEAKFHLLNISGFTPVLRAPLAETTGGGAQAVQHMILEPKIDGDPVVTVGQVNLVTKTAKLRTFECLLALHAMRYGRRAFHVDQVQYTGFFKKALEFMRRQGLQVQIETRPPEVRPSQAPGAAMGANVLVWLLLFAVAALSVAAAYLAYSGKLAM